MSYGMAVCEAPGCNIEFERKSWNTKYHSEQCKNEVKNMLRRKSEIPTTESIFKTNLVTELTIPDGASELKYLRESNKKLWRDVEKAKAVKSEVVQAVYDAVSSNMKNLTIGPVKPPKLDKRDNGEEVAVPLISDLQLAKVTPTYDSTVCEAAMELLAQKICAITEAQRSDHAVRKCIVPVLGDIIEGVDIFPGQQWLVDGGLYRQITLDGPRIFINFFQTLLSYFDEVEVIWIIGNHGRLGMRGIMDPETNGDRMLGRIVSNMFEFAGEKRIKFHIPDGKGERHWYAIAKAGNWSALCLHGDQIGGSSGIPYLGITKKVTSWAAGGLGEPFGDVLMGHYHQGTVIPINKRTVWINGSTESHNTFAQEKLASMADPMQWLLFVHPEKGKVTAEYKIWL